MSNRIPLRVAAAALCVATATTSAQANRYVLVDLGANRVPLAVNRAGNAVGYRDVGRAMLLRGGHWRALDTDGQFASATAINGRGDVGGATDAGTPYLWPRGGSRLTVTIPAGGTWADVTALAADGTIVGTYYLDDSPRCYRSFSSGLAQDLGTLPGGTYCFAARVNEHDQIVGGAGGRDGLEVAFVWQDGLFRRLGILPGGSFSEASAINGRGHVVGTSDTGHGHHAFFWSGGAIKDIGASADYGETDALAINDQGEIVGEGAAVADQESHAVRFADGRVIDLRDEVDGAAQWKLFAAVDVNEFGVIVGFGELAGERHGFMLLPR